MGKFLLLPPNYYYFSFYLSGHEADIVGLLSLDSSLIWNAALLRGSHQYILLYCVVPQNIYTSPTEGIFSKPPPPHPSGNFQ